MFLTNIVIPCHNRLEHTRQTLESLFENTNSGLYKLDVVDDKSTDGTRDYLIRLYEEKKNFTLHLNKDSIGPAASRNDTCKLITDKGLRGDYLYHSDNDVYFKKGWLHELTHALSHAGTVKLLGGGCHPYLKNNSTISVGNEHKMCTIGIKDAVSGYSQLMTWETWDTYGDFSDSNRNAEKKIAGSEDWAYCQKIIKSGHLVGSLEPELVIHTGKTNTYNEDATGAETFKNIDGVMIK